MEHPAHFNWWNTVEPVIRLCKWSLKLLSSTMLFMSDIWSYRFVRLTGHTYTSIPDLWRTLRDLNKLVDQITFFTLYVYTCTQHEAWLVRWKLLHIYIVCCSAGQIKNSSLKWRKDKGFILHSTNKSISSRHQYREYSLVCELVLQSWYKGFWDLQHRSTLSLCRHD